MIKNNLFKSNIKKMTEEKENFYLLILISLSQIYNKGIIKIVFNNH